MENRAFHCKRFLNQENNLEILTCDSKAPEYVESCGQED